MATKKSTKGSAVDRPDPIEHVQTRVIRAEAMCRCLAEASETVSSYELDLLGALGGLADMLGDIALTLDPDAFRAAVLAGQDAEVAHG